MSGYLPPFEREIVAILKRQDDGRLPHGTVLKIWLRQQSENVDPDVKRITFDGAVKQLRKKDAVRLYRSGDLVLRKDLRNPPANPSQSASGETALGGLGGGAGRDDAGQK